MADPRGFIEHDRHLPRRRPTDLRLLDWKEVYEPFPEASLRAQASRCMDCGIPFCTSGCPLGNIIPDWNDLVYRGQWREAADRLHATNNFPEFTGRLCPAPCETSCVLGIHRPAVTIKQVEVRIVDKAWNEEWIRPHLPGEHTGKRVAVVGSGPAGLAAAQQLTRAGHSVVVYERADRVGGLLRYGIPEFKMEKSVLDRRVQQMRDEGTEFVLNAAVGVDIAAAELSARFDAVVLACGSTRPRDLDIAGRDLGGIHQAMDFLPLANRVQEGDIEESPLSAEGLDVIIIGGGDTGADCLGTSLRQGARSVRQFEIMPQPGESRPDENPWPTWPLIHRVSSAHEEGGEREFSINTVRFIGDPSGNVSSLETVRVATSDGNGRPSFDTVEGSEETFDAQMVLLAMGFVGAENGPLLEQFGVELNASGVVPRDQNWETNIEGVFVCGDMGRGQSLIVWAIAEGRSTAAAVDRHLMGETALPTPIEPTSSPIC